MAVIGQTCVLFIECLEIVNMGHEVVKLTVILPQFYILSEYIHINV